MRLFFDTRYTEPHKNTTIISIGIVDENNCSFYAEFSDYYDVLCDKWTDENVIKYLKWDKNSGNYLTVNPDNCWEVHGTTEYIKDALTRWLSDYDEEIELVSDCCHYNMVLFIDIFGGAWDIPGTINPVCHDINQDIAKYFKVSEKDVFSYPREDIIETYNKKINEYWPEECVKIEGCKNTALYGAKLIKEVFNLII